MNFNKLVSFDKDEFTFSKKLIKSKEKIHPPGSVYSFGAEIPKVMFENQKEVSASQQEILRKVNKHMKAQREKDLLKQTEQERIIREKQMLVEKLESSKPG